MLLFEALSDKQTRQNGVNKNEQAVYLFDVGLRLKAEVCESGLPAESRPSTFVAVSVAKRSATYVVVRSTVRQANEAKRSKQKRTSGLLVRCWFTTKSRSLREWSTCRESNSDQCRRRASFYPLDYR